jgi:hypothetical protein
VIRSKIPARFVRKQAGTSSSTLSQRQDISLLHRVEQIFDTAASWKNLTTAICKERRTQTGHAIAVNAG